MPKLWRGGGSGGQIPPSAPPHRLSLVSRTAACRAARENDGVSSSRWARRSRRRTQEACSTSSTCASALRPTDASRSRTFHAALAGPARTHSGQISPSNVPPENSLIPHRLTRYCSPQHAHSQIGVCDSSGNGRKGTMRSIADRGYRAKRSLRPRFHRHTDSGLAAAPGAVRQQHHPPRLSCEVPRDRESHSRVERSCASGEPDLEDLLFEPCGNPGPLVTHGEFPPGAVDGHPHR